MSIAENAGQDGGIVAERVAERKGNEGYNAATDKYEDLVKAGVIDPTKVTRTALQNAASVATLLLTSDALIAEAPRKIRRAAVATDTVAWMTCINRPSRLIRELSINLQTPYSPRSMTGANFFLGLLRCGAWRTPFLALRWLFSRSKAWLARRPLSYRALSSAVLNAPTFVILNSGY